MESFVKFEEVTIENTIGHMEDIDIKKEFDNITLDNMKQELPLNEIKNEICTDMEDNTSGLDNKLSGSMEDIDIKKEFDDITLDVVKHELPLNDIKCKIYTDMEDNDKDLDNNLSVDYYKYTSIDSGRQFCNRLFFPHDKNATIASTSSDESVEISIQVDGRMEDDSEDPDFAPDSELEDMKVEANIDDHSFVPDSDLSYLKNNEKNKKIDNDAEIKETNSELTQENFGVHKQNGEVRKGNKKKDFCFFCQSLVLNFARHIQRNHSTEMEVQKILSLPPKSKARTSLLNELRKKGNYLNSNVISKPIQMPRSGSNLLPCANCLGFYSAKLLWRHRKYCIGKNSKTSKAEAQNLLLKDLKIDSQLKEMVFPKMRADDISLVAKKDPLICAFGARYLKIHHGQHFIHVISRKMREIARLLIDLRQRDHKIKNLFDALKPTNFELLVDCTKSVAQYDHEKCEYKSPSYAFNIGTTLKQCAELAIVFALETKDIAETISPAKDEADLKTLIQFIESQWQDKISIQVANNININNWYKVSLVPLAEDLKLLREFLILKATTAVFELNTSNDNKEQYVILLETIFCRVLLLNRRRPGELQKLSLDLYEKSAYNASNYKEFSDVISPSEKILLKKFKSILIRGKRRYGAPVLFSTDIQEHIEVLLKYRRYYVKKDNFYLFGNPNTTSPICGYKVLEKYAKLSGAKNPKAITTTEFRKHLATLTQIFNMSENDLEQLAHFMSHNLGIHIDNYNLPDDIYQTAKISKLLLLMEEGKATDFNVKQLNEIDINLDEDLPSMKENEQISDDNEHNTFANKIFNEINNVTVNKCIKKRRILEPWTDEQKQIVREYFSDHIKNKKPPRKNECEALKDIHSELLWNKDWLKIKSFVQNLYSKKI